MGKLTFAAHVVFGGSIFLWRMIDTGIVNIFPRPNRHICPTAELKADLSCWAEYLILSYGTRFFVDSKPMDVSVN